MIFPFFNLLVNSTFSLLAGLLVVSLCLWIFRVETGRWKLFLLSLPFCKILFDFFLGVPANSILVMGIDPFSLPQHSRFFSIGAGATWLGPRLNAVFSVKDINGHEFAASIGDYLVIGLSQAFGAWIPFTIFMGLVGVSIARVGYRIFQMIRFEQIRKQDRLTAKRLDHFSTTTLDVYVSKYFKGSPFTGGLFKNFICIPEEAALALSPPELEAVVAHEIAHVRSFDLLGTLFIQMIGDFFWFIPGYRWLSRRLDRLREILADEAAVKSGTNPLQLASALVTLKEIAGSSDSLPVHSAFFRERSLLKTRVDRLLGQSTEPRARWGWQFSWFRWLMLFWIAVAVFLSSLGGNRADQIEFNHDVVSNFLNVLKDKS